MVSSVQENTTIIRPDLGLICMMQSKHGYDDCGDDDDGGRGDCGRK